MAVSVTLSAGEEEGASVPPLRLRPWRDDDLAALLEAYDDPEMRRWAPVRMESEDDVRAWLRAQAEGWADGERLSFAVLEGAPEPADVADVRPLGNVVLKDVRPDKESAEVGYWTAAWARGRNVAPRAVEAVVRWAFASEREVPLKRMELLHSIHNDASCRVAQKAGFALEAVLPPLLPDFPTDGHLHVRTAPER